MTCKYCSEPHGIIEKIVYNFRAMKLIWYLQHGDKSKEKRRYGALSKKKRKALLARRYEMDKKERNQ